jgi:hypothetical protein
LVSVFGFKDKQGNFRPTGGSGIYQKETSNKAVPTTTKTNFNLQLPGYRNFMQGRRDEMAYRKSTKETNKKINEKDKKAKEQLKLEFDENEKKIKDIRKQMDKGKISSGEAQLLVGKIMGGTTIKTGAMPSGKIELDEMGQHHKRILEKRIADNKKAQEDLTKQKSDNKTTKAKTATGSGNTSEDTKEWNDDLQKDLEKLQKEKTELQLELVNITGGNPDTSYNKNAMVPSIEKQWGESGNSPSRKTESDVGSLPSGKTIRDREEKEARHELQYGESIPTFTSKYPYQKKRKDPYTGEYTSQMADTNIEKELARMAQGYSPDLTNEQLAEALETISKNTQIDPTQYYKEPKGMGALIGLRASMAGRRN